MERQNPVFILVHGSLFTPSHYALLQHLLMESGYGVLSSLLPSSGVLDGARGTLDDDAAYIRNRLVRPMLGNEARDVILLCHSAGALPGSAAVSGLSKPERGARPGVLGQIFIAPLLARGGDGSTMLGTAGGQLPERLRPDVSRSPAGQTV